MANSTRQPAAEVWITGIGLASSLGEGLDAHWDALRSGRINVDDKTFAPWMIHPLPPINFDSQIPRKGDQRQMETWQLIGVYTAGLALESAGIKGNAEILERTHIVAAAGAGERDLVVDARILTERVQGDTSPTLLNERLMKGLRPTLGLTQLTNLLAGNISIVHGVTGSSRTLMGEEIAGVDAARIALARIAAGECDIALIGGANNAARPDQLMLYEFGDFNLKDRFAPVWSRGPKGGFALGSGGAFLVLESRQHAEARGAKPYARLTRVVSDHVRRTDGAVAHALEKLWKELGADTVATAIITGATGAEPATSEERAFLAAHKDIPVRSSSTSFGHTMEMHFPLGLALAALSLSKGELIPASDSSGVELAMPAKPSRIVVIGAGHWRGEGMALVEAVD